MNFYQSRALLRQLIVNKIKGSPHNQVVLEVRELLSFVHNRNHGDKENYVKMLFSRFTKTLSNEKKKMSTDYKKKSCAKVLNYLQTQA
jgi:hypothetical protein